jgi:hypothetical protein
MITMDENILAVWVIEIRSYPSEGNWMASLSKTKDGFALTYRFRWYVDEKAHDSADKRNWYRIDFGPPHAHTTGDALRHGREIYDMTIRSLGKHATVPHSWELIRGARSVEEFCDALTLMPGMHQRKISEKEAQELGFDAPRH